MARELRTRIAPTPSGFLHVGNAFSFISSWLLARRSGGTLVLRIDDLDSQRKRDEYVEDVFLSLDWLGLDVDEGPSGPGDLRRFSQTTRVPRYEALLQDLLADDRLFGCGCSRKTIAAERDGAHPRSCRDLAEIPGAGHAWRTRTPSHSIDWLDKDGHARSVPLDATMRDFVVRRRDGLPAYQIASLADDLDMEINAIVRGEDLLPSTAAQRWLAECLDASTFLHADFLHHGLLTDTVGQKLSKSAGATSLRAWREAGKSSALLYRELSPRFGLHEPVSSAAELLGAMRASHEDAS